MSARLHQCLGRLVDLGERDVDRARAHWAEKQGLCTRLQGAVERLDTLARTDAAAQAAGPLIPGLLANGGAYKAALLDLAATQRQALARSRTEALAAQAAVATEARRVAALGQVQAQVGGRLQQAATRREQQGQDALATQVWLRGGHE